VVATAINSAETCVLDAPASRRFYVHIGSLGFLIAAQPSIFEEVAEGLALSGASRALDQAAEDWDMFPSTAAPKVSLAQSAANLHKLAADALRYSFQCIVHLDQQQFGATELLLGPTEQINAWCYEDGYLTYATDANAASIMYAETGSLRELRSKIRRSPDFDPALQMISGQSLFLYDQRVKTGSKTALTYRKQAARLLRNSPGSAIPPELVKRIDTAVADALDGCVSPTATTFDGDSVLETCQRRADLMVRTLLRAIP
jgi:hypothetical protein